MATAVTPVAMSVSVFEGVPVNPELENSKEKKEIDDIWRQVQDRVIQIAGGDPRKIERTMDIDGVLKYIENSKDLEKKSADKYGWVKTTFQQTLQCIQTVGGIVADGASYVFGPAQSCYNALTFVIKAWQGYEGIFESLAELFEKCVEFLERLHYYARGKMDLKLTRVAAQHLQLFVEICDTSIKLRKKHLKLKMFTKQLFLGDAGIQDLLDKMGRLVDKERGLVTAQTFMFVNDIDGNVKALLEENREQKKEDEAKKWRQSIVKALGFDQTNLDRDKEPITSWLKMYNTYKSNLIDDTGKWILENQQFLAWIRGADSSSPILVLEGQNKTGKTFMMTNLLKHLRKLDILGAKDSISYFYLETNAKRSEARESALEVLSRSLLWQCVSAFEPLTKSVAQICDKVSEKGGFDNALDTWKQVFLQNSDREKMDNVFYILLDGLDDDIPAIMPLLQELSRDSMDRKLRLFLTAKPKTVEGLTSDPYITFDIIRIQENNSTDIEKYITYRMNMMDILKDEDRSGISEWRSQILTTLREKCAGDFFRLITSLDKIAKFDLAGDITGVLEKADETRTNQIDAEIQRLNKTRTTEEIVEINEIILWIITANQWLTVAEMEAVLSLMPDGSSIPPLTSLLPFDIKLKTKYPIFQIDHSGWVNWRSPEIEERIPRKTPDPTAETPVAELKEISDSEVEIMKHVLHTVCPPGLYEQFKFEDFLNEKKDARWKTFVCQDPDNAHIRIALTCLKVLTDKRNERTSSLLRYAGQALIYHLTSTDLSLADRSYKSKVGRLLLKLFTEEYAIDSLFWLSEKNISQKTWLNGEHEWLKDIRTWWLYSFDGVEEIARWFKDRVAMRDVHDPDGKQFVSAFNTATAHNRHEVLLAPAAKHIASHLLRSDSFSTRECWTVVFFLNGFVSKLYPEQNSDAIPRSAQEILQLDTDEMDKIEKWKLSLEEIDRIEKWCLKAFGEEAADSLWEVQMAYTISDMTEDDERTALAEKRARKALETDPANLLASYYVATESASAEEAITILSAAIEKVEARIAADPNWTQSMSHQDLTAFMCIELGNRYWDSGQRDLAAAAHLRSLTYSDTRYSMYTGALERYRDAGAWTEMIAFLDKLNAGGPDWPPYFDELVNDLLLDNSFAKMAASAAQATGRWDVIETLFTLSIDISAAGGFAEDGFFLRQTFGDILNAVAANEDKAIAVWEAALGDAAARASDRVTKTDVFTIVDVLCRIYLNRAFPLTVTAEAATTSPTAAVSVSVSMPLSTDAVRELGSKIKALVQDAGAWPNAVVSCTLARFHHRLGEASEARALTKDLVSAALELLSDDDPSNDFYAFCMLARPVNTLGDVDNTIAVWEMLNLIQANMMKEWAEWEEREKAKQKGKGAASVNGDVAADDGATKSVGDGGEGDGGTGIDSERKGEDGDAVAAKEDPQPNGEMRNGVLTIEEHGTKAVTEPGTAETNQANPEPSRDNDMGSGAEPGASPQPDHDVASVDSESPSVSTMPERPGAMIICDGCGAAYMLASEIYTCEDCVGLVQFDEKCYRQHVAGRLEAVATDKRLLCRRDHHFIFLPRWEPARAKEVPTGSVPVGRRMVTMEEWKKGLRMTYLGGEEGESGGQAEAGKKEAEREEGKANEDQAAES